ncbi:hypothetical protein C8N35_108155 [Breoghania corrubedonensis]|uniref:Uncharacterized protein n=1 Tax=Breoghania corrubedonensis TaxID=665038 RepID=A0A2T5V5T9_9HYPH|nr:hypothetical protein [Breoghania corrubedonensis]PTW59118.1 hypothetical protein C8N35_108155 [Breoghania corrubedonensis]
MQYHRGRPFGADDIDLTTHRVGARRETQNASQARPTSRGRLAGATRHWPAAAGIGTMVALTPVLASAATQSTKTSFAFGVAWLVFVAMVVVVVAMWRHFARRMLANLHPRWEDWG